MEKANKNVEQTTENGWTDTETGKFVKGNRGGGRPKGSENFKTKMFKAMEKIAEMNGEDVTVDDIEEQLLLVGYKKAKEGDYQFYRDLFDRIYGKPQQYIDHTTNEESLNKTSTLDDLAVDFVIANKKKYETKQKPKRKSDGV